MLQRGNFGRIARVRIMDDYMRDLFQEELLGIPLDSSRALLSPLRLFRFLMVHFGPTG